MFPSSLVFFLYVSNFVLKKTKRFTAWLDVPGVRAHPLAMLGGTYHDPQPPRMVWHERRSNRTRHARVLPGQAFHFANAFDEGSDLVVIGCRSNETSFYLDAETVTLTPYLHEWRINVVDGNVVERDLVDLDGAPISMEFPSIHPARHMKKMRFVYGMIMSGVGGTAGGVVKYDLETGEAKRYLFGHNKTGQEPLFVPGGDAQQDEDFGSLLTFCFDPLSKLSSLVIVCGSFLLGMICF